jgi:hypothetical protein
MRKLLLFLVLVLSASCATTAQDIPHLRQVRANVWAAGQPTPSGFRALAKRFEGKAVHVIKLNFASEGPDDEARLLGWDVHELGIIPRTDYKGVVQAAEEVFELPDQQTWAGVVSEIRKIPAADDGREVWLFHCVNGNDRTNEAIGHVRVIIDHWPKDNAFDEMLSQGFHWELVGLYRQWKKLPEATCNSSKP